MNTGRRKRFQAAITRDADRSEAYWQRKYEREVLGDWRGKRAEVLLQETGRTLHPEKYDRLLIPTVQAIADVITLEFERQHNQRITQRFGDDGDRGDGDESDRGDGDESDRGDGDGNVRGDRCPELRVELDSLRRLVEPDHHQTLSQRVPAWLRYAVVFVLGGAVVGSIWRVLT